mgnify:FL=1
MPGSSARFPSRSEVRATDLSVHAPAAFAAAVRDSFWSWFGRIHASLSWIPHMTWIRTVRDTGSVLFSLSRAGSFGATSGNTGPETTSPSSSRRSPDRRSSGGYCAMKNLSHLRLRCGSGETWLALPEVAACSSISLSTPKNLCQSSHASSSSSASRLSSPTRILTALSSSLVQAPGVSFSNSFSHQARRVAWCSVLFRTTDSMVRRRGRRCKLARHSLK